MTKTTGTTGPSGDTPLGCIARLRPERPSARHADGASLADKHGEANRHADEETARTMAAIYDLDLKLIDHDLATRRATIAITYRAVLAPEERNLPGLCFREIVHLCGAFSLDPEDFLHQLAERRFSFGEANVVHRERMVTIDDSILEEDGIPQPADALYAKVWVLPVLPRGDMRQSPRLTRGGLDPEPPPQIRAG